MTASEPGSVQQWRPGPTDLDTATGPPRAAYPGPAPASSGPPEAFTFTFEAASGATGPHPGGVGPDRLTVAVLRVGDRRGAPGREQATVTVMLNPTWPRWRAGRDDIDVTVATLDAVGVRLIGAEISGLDPAGVTFTGTGPVSPALGRYMAATMTQVERDLVDDELMASPLIRREAFRRLAVGLLVAFPNTTQSIAPARGPDHEPATVRRAVAYIDAHALDDIDISQIAAAARIGPRGLQAAFRKHRGQTPLEYLRQVRMDGAHRDLMAGDPTRGDTVAATAARWRFTHAGRFSVEYRESHGRSPSQTLRR